MPATRSQADAVAGGAEPEVAGPLEDAAAEFSAESAARKAAEERVRALEARLAGGTGAAGGGDRFSTPLPSSEEEDAVGEDPLAEAPAEGVGGERPAAGLDGGDGERPAVHKTADEILAAYLSPDPAVRGTVSADEVAWAKDAKATGKLLAEEPAGGGQSALFAAVQAQNASLLGSSSFSI